jgi:hypothetical protein
MCPQATANLRACTLLAGRGQQVRREREERRGEAREKTAKRKDAETTLGRTEGGDGAGASQFPKLADVAKSKVTAEVVTRLVGKRVRVNCSKSQGEQLGRVESASNGYYQIALETGAVGQTINVRFAEMSEDVEGRRAPRDAGKRSRKSPARPGFVDPTARGISFGMVRTRTGRSRALRALRAALRAAPMVDRFCACTARLYGRAGRVTAKHGGSRPGQSAGARKVNDDPDKWSDSTAPVDDAASASPASARPRERKSESKIPKLWFGELSIRATEGDCFSHKAGPHRAA